MLDQSIVQDLTSLPKDVLSLVDEKFYEFVQKKLGEQQSDLLKLQQINSVSCFLLVDDPCEILNLNIDSEELVEVKKKVCFLLSNGSFMVKPGVRSSFQCFRHLLQKKTEETLKEMKRGRMISPPLQTVNILSSSSINTPSHSNIIHRIQTVNSLSSSKSDAFSIDEHRKYVLNLLDHWCSNQKEDFGLSYFELKEGIDFDLKISYDEHGQLRATVKCRCSKLINLAIKIGRIQLSNYQKHIRMTKCSHMKHLKDISLEQRQQNLYQSTIEESSFDSDEVSSPQQYQGQRTTLESTSSINHSLSAAFPKGGAANREPTANNRSASKRPRSLVNSSQQRRVKRTRR